MADQHPITPPLELVEQWSAIIYRQTEDDDQRDLYIATQAARWGADQELEACCEWLGREVNSGWGLGTQLRAARRPKPLSLKEQALQALANADGADHPVVATVLTADQHALIRKALEQLND